MTEADNFFEALKNDPQAILDWCDSEIAEYQKLKELIEKQIKNDRKTSA